MSSISVSTWKLARRFIAVALLAPSLLVTGWGFSLQGKTPSVPGASKAKKNEGHRQIERLEEKWHDAILKSDVSALDSLLADDFVAIEPNGTLETKDQTLADIRAGRWHLTTLDYSDRKIRFYGRTALVTSQAQVEGSGPEGDMTGTYRYTRVYARDNRGVYKIVNFEASRIGHKHQPPKENTNPQ